MGSEYDNRYTMDAIIIDSVELNEDYHQSSSIKQITVSSTHALPNPELVSFSCLKDVRNVCTRKYIFAINTNIKQVYDNIIAMLR